MNEKDPVFPKKALPKFSLLRDKHPLVSSNLCLGKFCSGKLGTRTICISPRLNVSCKHIFSEIMNRLLGSVFVPNEESLKSSKLVASYFTFQHNLHNYRIEKKSIIHWEKTIFLLKPNCTHLPEQESFEMVFDFTLPLLHNHSWFLNAKVSTVQTKISLQVTRRYRLIYFI